MKINYSNAFTLVELAIVMTIIGLLIGGILKGQELLQNARITSTIAQVKSYNAAHVTFRDTYDAVAGDIAKAQDRIPNCTTAVACANGDGSGLIGVTMVEMTTDIHWNNNISVALSGENVQFWKHLALASLITGVNPNLTTLTGGPDWGSSHPRNSMIGGFHARAATDYLAPNSQYANMSGNMLVWRNSNASSGNGGNAVSPYVAEIIDRKMDDGRAFRGSVQAVSGNTWSGGATSGCNPSNVVATQPNGYNSVDTTIQCDMAFKLD